MLICAGSGKEAKDCSHPSSKKPVTTTPTTRTPPACTIRTATCRVKDFIKLIYNKRYSTIPKILAHAPFPYRQVLTSRLRGTTERTGETESMVLYLEKITTPATISSSSIIANNISKRPVYFTSRERDAVRGTTRKLARFTNSSHRKPYPTCRKHRDPYPEKFIQEKYVPVLSDDRGFICFDGDSWFFTLFLYAFEHYLEKKDMTWLWLLVRQIRFDLPEAVLGPDVDGKYMYRYYIEAGNNKRA